MEDEKIKEESAAELVWGIESAELAYGVIARYVDHAQISGMVIALLASALGEERVKPLTQSEYWQAYMAGRRSLMDAREEVDQLTQMIERMRGRQQ
ncbi:MAG: hypothetical protein ACK562_13525 [Acidobacteriota bacterium]|jgi:hypothetical protein